MGESPCPGDERLLALVAGEKVDATLQPHIQQCTSCSRRLQQLRAESAKLRQIRADNGTLPKSLEETADLSASPPLSPSARAQCDRSTMRRDDAVDAGRTIDMVDAPTGASVLHGKRIDRFEIREMLGEGAFGSVYLAHDPQLDRKVAIKVSRTGVIVGQSEIDRFMREARSAAQLRHPHIIPVHEAGQFEGINYIAYEFIDGETLESMFKKRGKLTCEEASGLISKLASALHYAHSLGIIHRDMKPDNVMIDHDGEPHIADFGLAYRDEGNTTRTRDGALMGTPAYMSPEQASGKAHLADSRTDVWSLGVMLEELLTGVRPFGGSVSQVLERIRVTEAKPLRQRDPSIARDLETIVQKCLAKAPDGRYQTASELADDLDRWRRDEPIKARHIGLLGRTWRWARRNPAVASSLAAVGITLLVATVVSSFFAYIAYQNNLLAEQRQTERALAQVDALLTAVPSSLPYLVEGLEPFRRDVLPRLWQLRKQGDLSNDQRARIRLALLRLSEKARTTEALGQLREHLMRTGAAEFLVARSFLEPFASQLRAGLWQTALDEQQVQSQRLRAACALALYAPEDERWSDFAPNVVPMLLRQNSLDIQLWIDALRPVDDRLLPALKRAFHAEDQDQSSILAATVLSEVARDHPDLLVELVDSATTRQLAVLLPRLERHADHVESLLTTNLQQKEEASADETLTTSTVRQANILVSLLFLGRADRVWPLLASSEDNSVRTATIARAGPAGVPPNIFLERLLEERDATVLIAVLSCLVEYRSDQILASRRQALLPELLYFYENHPHPGVHSVLGWLLERWGYQDHVVRVDLRVQSRGSTSGRTWYVDGQSHSFAVFHGPVTFKMGSPSEEPDRTPVEWLHRRKIPRSFAIATKEVTVKQFLRCVAEHQYQKKYAPEPQCPVIETNWPDAVKYCRWLSEQEGVPEDQMCYPPLDQIGPRLTLPPDLLERTGYRLPTAAEWEYAARSGSVTSRHYGESEGMLGRYAWYDANSENRTWPVGRLGPNDFGLFDMHGNALEWCHSWYFDEYPPPTEEGFLVDGIDSRRGIYRELRGGSFLRSPAVVRSADRDSDVPAIRGHETGFRIARTIGVGDD